MKKEYAWVEWSNIGRLIWSSLNVNEERTLWQDKELNTALALTDLYNPSYLYTPETRSPSASQLEVLCLARSHRQ